MVVGIFVGRFLGMGNLLVGGLEVAQRVDFGGVGCGRAWVSSLPKIFVGKYFHFWKLPPLFCINNRDNVYYPVFLTCYIIWETGIKYAVICIVSVCRSVKMLSQTGGFSLGKARVRVHSFPQPLTLSTTQPTNPLNYPQPY